MTLTPDAFVSRFFSPPNGIWPKADPNDQIVSTIGPFLTALTKRGECPVILPRRDLMVLPATLYVICWDTGHAGRIRSLLEAAVAHHWCQFDGRVARLEPADPIELSILDLVGPGTTFVLRPTQQTAAPTFRALQRLVSTLGAASLRTPTAARPVGRMLREFDVALASGATQTSLMLLKEIEGFGGISHENVAFLQIRRLAHLGHDHDLLTHGSLPTLIYTEPPRLVREAVLAAWARARVIPVLETDGVDKAIAVIRDSDPDIAMLVDASLHATQDAGVATICALVALLRRDRYLAAALQDNSGVAASVRVLSSALAGTPSTSTLSPVIGAVAEAPSPVESLAEESLSPTATPEEPEESVELDLRVDLATLPLALNSWTDWVAQLETADQASPDAGAADHWAPVWSIDDQLAAAVDGLPELAVDDLLTGVAWFLETDDPDNPASLTAMALIRHYLLAERFSPSDLGALCSLIQIVLRGAPGPDSYRELLDDLRSYAPQWVAVATATRVLDIADAVACGPNVDPSSRSGLVATLLAPLNEQKRRLSGSLRGLAASVGGDVGLDFDWTVEAVEPEGDGANHDSSSLDPKILLYSLDTGTLARVQAAIGDQWPRARVSVSAVKVGNASLRGQTRGADIIVIATRRAAHAATGFITDNAAPGATIAYPDGSGSASMLRVVESALADWAMSLSAQRA